jgi:FtsP/CotA-like multicopper oxidase with cupredoxin domain
MERFKIQGLIREKESGTGVGNLLVKAYDQDLLFDDLLGTALTGADGKFEIEGFAGDFSELLEQCPDIYLKIYTRDTRREIYSTEEGVRYDAEGIENFEVSIPAANLGELAPSHAGLLTKDGEKDDEDEPQHDDEKEGDESDSKFDPCAERKLNIRNIYLKIEEVLDYSPVEPDPHAGGQYRRDCMRNPGHEDATIPLSEVNARRLDALIYREYLDPGYLIPKPDKIVLADINEPVFSHRVPGTVIYAQPGERLHIHVLNADSMPHSLQVHGLSYGIDSDGSWPLGTQNSDGRRSDEICPGQSWTYRFDVTEKMIGAWPFHDHCRMIAMSVNRGLFGGIIVHPPQFCDFRCEMELPPLVADFLAERLKLSTLDNPVNQLPPHGHAAIQPHAAGGGGMRDMGGMDMGGMGVGGGRSHAPFAVEDYEVEARREFLEEWAALEYAHPRPAPTDVLHVPLFTHFMSRDSGTPAFDSGQFPPGAALFQVTFGGAVTLNYHCEIHPSMQGTVIVAPGEPTTADVFIIDSPGPMAFSPAEVRVAPGGTVRWHPGTMIHRITENGAGLPSYCLNGRCFVGNTPTIVAHAGQRIRWYIFNLDLGMMWHNFHPHSQRWQFANETIDGRSIGPAESFIVETIAPPVLLLPPDIQATQHPKCRLEGAEPYKIRGDFLFHCHVEMHMMQGLAGIVRSKQTIWLTKEQFNKLEADTGIPLDDGRNDCPVVDLDHCEMTGCGIWEEVAGIPEVTQMHMALVPKSEKVIYWGYGDTRDDVTRVWDYSTTTGAYSLPGNQPFNVTSPPNNRGLANIWSAEHAYLNDADGTLLVHGGFTPREAYLFHPPTLSWSRINPTAQDRFYSTTLTLANGKILTLFGSASRSIEVFDPGLGTWSAPKNFPPEYNYVYYPWTYLLPSGELFVAGPTGESRRFDWTPAAIPLGTMFPTIAGNRSTGGEKGTSVLLPLRPPDYKPQVLIAGGNTAAAQQTSEMIDLSAAAPAWTALPNLNQARPEQVNTVLLPDGRVFLAGGIDGANGGPTEIFDPRNPAGGWSLCATMKYTRGYHSSAILLADGSVLMGGDRVGAWKSGETTPSERYFPSYYMMSRPVITNAPATIGYGANFTVDTPSPSNIAEVVLLRPGAVTHGFNMSQRFIECAIVGGGPTSLQVQAPPNGNLAPPGYYLLFIVTGGRVPSIARWVRLS